MDPPHQILICFAVKEEVAHFRPSLANGRCVILISGMGRKNAAEAIRKALATMQPRLVITAGFAGGLNPDLKVGNVVFEEESTGLSGRLSAAGAVQGRFYCADRVAVTAKEKAALWQATGADAVEMESSVIRTICCEKNIPSATVRVISDAAGEDLPLDFNALMTADMRINFWKLALMVAGSPGKIPQLMRFQKQTAMAARALGKVLGAALAEGS